VQIDGESYWDGSYGANPVLWPLYDGKGDVDILLVELAPIRRPETPTTAKNIMSRINELASVGGMVSELRLMDSITARSGQTVRTHLISLPDTVAKAQAEPSTKRTIDLSMFQNLREEGRQACATWLEQNGDALGQWSSDDVRGRYVSPYEPAIARQGRAPGGEGLKQADCGETPATQATALQLLPSVSTAV
jgi:NTE family protein